MQRCLWRNVRSRSAKTFCGLPLVDIALGPNSVSVAGRTGGDTYPTGTLLRYDVVSPPSADHGMERSLLYYGIQRYTSQSTADMR